MTDLTPMTLDEALAGARQVESYLFALDNANALKNADEVRLSPITKIAREVAEFMATLELVDELDTSESAVTTEFSDGGLIRTYFRPDNDGGFYESVAMDKGNIIASATGDTPAAARAMLEVVSR